MVYGNAGGRSGAGGAFTRNPATSSRELYFDFQFNAQGEDVVAGRQKLHDNVRLRLVLPAVWTRLNDICHELEVLFGNAQDFEFTIQSGVLFLLQTRRAKRTDWAALAIAVNMVDEGLLTPAEGLAQLDGIDLDAVVRTSFGLPLPETLATAQVAGTGGATGAVALDPDAAKRLTEAGTPAILVRRETVTTDIEGMAIAAGILPAQADALPTLRSWRVSFAKYASSAVQGWRSTLIAASAGSAQRLCKREIFCRSTATPARFTSADWPR
jgi:pyruvate,orthophosphate dikinase